MYLKPPHRFSHFATYKGTGRTKSGSHLPNSSSDPYVRLSPHTAPASLFQQKTNNLK